jgi:beta-catenin-like protein 1
MKVSDAERRARKAKKEKKSKAAEDAAIDKSMTEHFLGIFAALLRRLPGNSDPRLRLLAKFIEKDYEKIDRLVDIRQKTLPRLQAVENRVVQEAKGMGEEEKEDLEAEWLSQRLDAGLYTVQTVDTILAWLCAEDDGVRSKVSSQIEKGLDQIKASLKEQRDGIVDDGKDAAESIDMLDALIEAL